MNLIMETIKASELITNDDGSIFHLHLRPEELADNIVVVGDPARVDMVAGHFDHKEVERGNREFHAVTGTYRGARITALSTGIGPDNIDIVMNELDALANIDLRTKEIRPEPKSLRIVRVGTCGSVQAEVPVNARVISAVSIGIDGVLRFYKGHERVCDEGMEDAFIRHCRWTAKTARPYAVRAAKELVDKLHQPGLTVDGITLTAPGFYGPQGRVLRLPIEMPGVNEAINTFRHDGLPLVNYEMESAPLAGLSALMGHKAATICLVIANRATGDANPDYHPRMEELIEYTLNKLID